ncbi:(+)-neomenthol dehydrogenase [Spatholobus suberectus]|nr:(+)-neomenthol dehydrogenase [Spatholobus suberectus]
MGHKEKSEERKEKRLQEISLLRTIPYADHQRWWSKETIAVVTGGNRGIGFEISRQLADHGVTVILTSRDASVGVESIKVLQEGGLQDVACHQLDILDSSSIDQFCEWLKENYGGLDILCNRCPYYMSRSSNIIYLQVNNAGVNFNFGSDNSAENASLVIETNYYGTKRMIEAMVPLMKPSSAGGRIVNVSSRLGRLNGKRNRLENEALREQLSDVESLSEEMIDGMTSTFLQQVADGSWTSGGWPPTFTDYSVSKLAVNAYTRFMAKKLSERPDGEKIYINSYCPGWVKTALTGYAGSVTVEDGADTGVWLSLLPDQAISGKFFAERREINF